MKRLLVVLLSAAQLSAFLYLIRSQPMGSFTALTVVLVVQYAFMIVAFWGTTPLPADEDVECVDDVEYEEDDARMAIAEPRAGIRGPAKS